MKAVIDGVELDGTPDEIAQTVAAMRKIVLERTIAVDQKSVSGDAADHTGISSSIARRVLRRKALSEAQEKLLLCLASYHPSGIAYESIQKVTKLSTSQLAGVLGGFKTRVTTTPGYIKGAEFLWWEWDDESGGYKYHLAPAAFDAMKEVGLVKP
jgi:predicted transcriptional regulator with HTH domain